MFKPKQVLLISMHASRYSRQLHLIFSVFTNQGSYFLHTRPIKCLVASLMQGTNKYVHE